MVVRKLTRVVVSHKEYILHLLLCSDYTLLFPWYATWGGGMSIGRSSVSQIWANVGRGEGNGISFYILVFWLVSCNLFILIY